MRPPAHHHRPTCGFCALGGTAPPRVAAGSPAERAGRDFCARPLRSDHGFSVFSPCALGRASQLVRFLLHGLRFLFHFADFSFVHACDGDPVLLCCVWPVVPTPPAEGPLSPALGAAPCGPPRAPALAWAWLSVPCSAYGFLSLSSCPHLSRCCSCCVFTLSLHATGHRTPPVVFRINCLTHPWRFIL